MHNLLRNKDVVAESIHELSSTMVIIQSEKFEKSQITLFSIQRRTVSGLSPGKA